MNKVQIPILYECPHFVLINKPAGVQSQPGDYHTHLKSHVLDQMADPTLKLVHRLDTNVTGGMVLAKTKNAAKQFHKNLKDKGSEQGFVLRRRYIALIQTPPLGNNNREGVFNTQIANKAAETKFKIVDLQFDLILAEAALKNHLTLVVLELITGRKHQIREHLLTNWQTACVNDVKYGSSLVLPGTRQIGLHSGWIATRIGMTKMEFMIPVMFGQDLWKGFIDKEGNFLNGIQEQLKNWG